MFGMGWQELFLIFLVILLLFGARRIPDIAQGLGKGIREFKKALKESEDDVTKSLKENESKQIKPDDKRNG